MVRKLFIPGAVLLVLGTAAFSINSSSSRTPMAAPDSTDQEVVSFLVQTNRDEISQARVALATTKNDEVRQFAQKMITEHSQALTKVQAIGKRLGYTASDTLPAAQPSDSSWDSTASQGNRDSTIVRDSNRTVRDSSMTPVRDSNRTSNEPYPRNSDSASTAADSGSRMMHDSAKTEMQDHTGMKMGGTGDATYIDNQVVAHQQVLKKLQTLTTGLNDNELKKYVADTRGVVQTHLKEARRLQSRLQKTS